MGLDLLDCIKTAGAGVLEYFRVQTVGFLFTAVAYLSNVNLETRPKRETATLSNDRKSLEVSFVFQGKEHIVKLPYNPYRIQSSDVKIYDKEGKLMSIHYTTCPGLQDFLFKDDVLTHFYGDVIGKVEIDELWDD